MAGIKILGGSIDRKYNWDYFFGSISGTRLGTASKSYSVKSMKELAVADERTGVKVLGAVGWGTVGVLIAGPLGAVVGGLLGGRGEVVTFVGKFDDGATIMGQVSKKIWLKMLAERV